MGAMWRMSVHDLREEAPALSSNIAGIHKKFVLSNYRAATLLAFVLYLIISYSIFGSMQSWTSNHLGDDGDPVVEMWCLNWWPYALSHGINPFWTKFVWYPIGADMAWVTSIPTLSFLSLPLTITVGPVVSFNVLSICAPALSATSAFMLATEITDDFFAAAIAGFIFGFSAYEAGQMQGHLNLDFTALVPLIILCIVRRVKSRLQSRTFIALISAALILQAGISIEILASLCVQVAL